MRKLEAESSARIQEMHETVTADMERLLVHQNAFVVAVNNHQAAMVNQTHLIQQQFEAMEDLEHNAHAAAENSWWSNIGVIVLAIVLAVATLGLVSLMVMLGARFERKLIELKSVAESETAQVEA